MRTAILLVLAWSSAWAVCSGTHPTFTAASPAYADVNACLSLAADGDAIDIPAGSATWSHGDDLLPTVHVSLIGAGQGSTTITFGDSVMGGGGSIQYNPTGTTGAVRVCCMTWLFTALGSNANAIATLMLDGSYAAFNGVSNANIRIDHLTVTNPRPVGKATIGIGTNTWNIAPCTPIYPEIDNITWTADVETGFALQYGCDNAWQSPENFSTGQFAFLEASSFTAPTAWSSDADVWDTEHGGRYVMRALTIKNMLLSGHDSGSTGQAMSQRAYEIYNNVSNSDGVAAQNTAFGIRGGTGLFYDNKLQIFQGSTGMNEMMSTEVWRSSFDAHVLDTTVNPWSSYAGQALIHSGGQTKVCYYANYSALASHCDGGTHPRCGINESGADNADGMGTNIACTAATCGGGTCGNCRNGCSVDADCGTGNKCVTLDGAGANGYPERNQAGLGQDNADHSETAASAPIYIWHNCDLNSATSGQCVSGAPIVRGGSPPSVVIGGAVVNSCGALSSDCHWITEGTEYYDYVDSGFNGTVGTGRGTHANRPNTCSNKVGYFETDTNTLFQCSAGSWVSYYTPFTFPHPIRTSAPPDQRQVSSLGVESGGLH